jgi:hypothetical protein
MLWLCACTTVRTIERPNEAPEYLITCGASSAWTVCYTKATSLCPAGYRTVSEDYGNNRKKELRVTCPAVTR